MSDADNGGAFGIDRGLGSDGKTTWRSGEIMRTYASLWLNSDSGVNIWDWMDHSYLPSIVIACVERWTHS